MVDPKKNTPHTGMQTSPWIILGSTIILLMVVLVMAYRNTHRERRYMSELLYAKGAALIRAVEAGARTGMRGMMCMRWGGQQIQQLLEETARLPDVSYMAVMDKEGKAVAHSDPDKIGQPFDKGRSIDHFESNDQISWEIITRKDEGKIFEVHHHFRPQVPSGNPPFDPTRNHAHSHPVEKCPFEEWFFPDNPQEFLIIVGLDVSPLDEAIRSDVQTTVLLSLVMLLLGFGGFVSLFWMNSYRITRQSLEDTSAFANEVVTHIPVGLIATNAKGRITFFNSAAEKITGIQQKDAIREKPDSVLPEKFCGIQQALETGDRIIEKEMECTFNDDRSVPVCISATRIFNETGDFVGQVLIIRDLGEVRHLQNEIRRQEKLAALGGLAAGVAHEIRNPLSSIKGLATYFAARFDEKDEAKETADVMIGEVDRLNRVITELLDFARPTDLKCRKTDLVPILNHSIQLIQRDAANQHIHIDVHIPTRPVEVTIDPDRFSQCLLNLYLNAIQAMTSGGTLTVSCGVENNKEIRITVRDTGKGIAPNQLSKIFDPYFTTKKKGNGLGLAIVHKIIEAHNAHLTVESLPDKGTVFIIRIHRFVQPIKVERESW